MKLDQFVLGMPPGEVAATATAAEATGYDGWFTAETGHDPMLAAALAAQATDGITIGTGIAVAFARSPMELAYRANDVQRLAEGRFVLGLGSQIKAHITRRFGMPWSSPAARMREYVQVLKAVWNTWNTGERLEFRGDFYEHTLMTPFFSPQPNPFGAPKVYLAAVGPKMTEVAGEVADGILCHAFTTDDYFFGKTLPRVRAGAERAGRSLADVDINRPVFVTTGNTDEEIAVCDQFVRGQIAFYASTPAYLPVLAEHGWEDLQPQLNALSKQGDWAAMNELITDEMHETFAIIGAPAEIGPEIARRYGGSVDRVSLYTTHQFSADEFAGFRSALADA